MTDGSREFGAYVLERRLGVGGMAETFAARRLDDGSRSCLKKVLPAYAKEPSFVEQFKREAELASKLEHPNIVRVYGSGVVGDELYMTMELVEGIDLERLLRLRGPLPAELVALLAHDVAAALSCAHAFDIVHRDVTPSNVLLACDGAVKLADFGIAKALSSTTAGTASGFLKGKIPYMAPEYMQGGKLGPHADLFALGVVLYEALACRRPFVGASDVEVMMRIVTGKPPPVRDLRPEASAPLARLAEQLIARNPRDRPESAEHVMRELAQHFSDGARSALRAMVSELHHPVEPAPSSATTERTAVMVAGPPVAAGDPPATLVAVAAPFDAPAEARKPGPLSVTDVVARPLRSSRMALVAVALIAGLVGATGFAWSTWKPRDSVSATIETTASGARPIAPLRVDEPSASPILPRGEAMPASPTAPPPTGASEASGEPDEAAVVGAAGEAERATEGDEDVVDAPSERSAQRSGTSARPRADEASTPHGRSKQRAEDATGRVRVMVVPWGDVWVNGRHAGRASLDVELAAGEHTIAAGVGRPSKRQRVRVQSGRTVTIELEVADSPQ